MLGLGTELGVFGWVAAAAAVGVVVMVLYSLLGSTRRASGRCTCGKVTIEAVVPASSHVFEQPTIHCACRDCVDFARWVANRSASATSFVDETSDSVNKIQFFRTDITITSGKEEVRACKLNAKAHLYRYYAACCNTPLGLSPELQAIPMVAMYRNLFDKADRAVFPEPRNILFFPKTKKGSKPPPGATPRNGMFVPSLMGPIIGRLLLGMILGKGQPDPFRLEGIDHSNPEFVR
eukprot:m.459614 g.459614  ORF g.459614 m.459614 type:complete len:235 (-) comp21791_c0_seq1:161-865(-)